MKKYFKNGIWALSNRPFIIKMKQNGKQTQNRRHEVAMF
jgi:hypothetical protein